MTPAQIFEAATRGYRIPAVDYGEHRGGGTLLAVGSGMMMAAMDEMPRLRWCLDLSGRAPDGLAAWLTFARVYAPPVVVCAWYSVTAPDALRDALDRSGCAPIVYANVDIGRPERRVASLAALFDAVQSLPDAF